MKKVLLFVLAFVVSSAFVLLSGPGYLTSFQKTAIIISEAIVFQILLMDKSFLKKEKRAELRKKIEDYPV
jgi:hypothetical protein